MNKQARSWIPSILLLIVLFVGGYWFMTRQFTINNSYSQQDFYESVQNNEVESVYIHPNKEYPTGRVSVDLTNGNSVQFYALDVKEIQDFLGDYSEIALEVGDVPGDNIFLSSVLPIILVAGMAFFLISMMSRQMSGGGGGGTNAKMMNFGKSRARMTVNEENKVISEKEKKITAYHEAGHAILFHLLPNMGPVHTISIIPTGLGAAGYTMPLPEADEMFNSKNKMLENIVVDLGGRVAEELIFKDVTTGASQDIKQATQLARAMVTQYGMSDKVGLINYGSDEDEVFIGRDLAHTRNYGEQTAAVIDSEVKRIIDEAYSQAKELIGSHIDVLHKCVELLLEKEKIGREEFEALFSENEEQKSLENDLGGTLYDLTKR